MSDSLAVNPFWELMKVREIGIIKLDGTSFIEGAVHLWCKPQLH